MVKKTITLILLFYFPLWLLPGVEFDGVDDKIDAGDATKFFSATPTNVSFFILVKIDNISDGGSLLNVTDGNELRWGFWFNNVGTVFRFSMDSAATDAVSSSAISVSTWYSLVGVYEGGHSTEKVRLYQDGIKQTIANPSATAITSSFSLVFGAKEDNSFSFTGSIAEAATWDGLLTEAEITLLANAKTRLVPLQIQPSNLTGYWTLDDHPDGSGVDGSTFLDRIGTGNGTGNDGANNTGLTAKAEEVLSYD